MLYDANTKEYSKELENLMGKKRFETLWKLSDILSTMRKKLADAAPDAARDLLNSYGGRRPAPFWPTPLGSFRTAPARWPRSTSAYPDTVR